MGNFIRRHWVIFFILLVSTIFRLADLGRQSFWYDETAEATAATLPTVGNAIELARYHTGAMPLDYMVIWTLGRISIQEDWLRLAPALWGIATVWVVYLVSRKIGGNRVALIASAFLALSPIHIYYSQELRYYSALCFYYWLLTLALYSAVETPTWRNWIWVILASVVGTYFHMFTMFAWLNGLGFWIAKYKLTIPGSVFWRRVIPSVIIIGCLIAPGLLIFGTENPFNYALNIDLLASQVLIAFGYLPLYYSPVGFVLGFSLLFAAIFGLSIVIRRRNFPVLFITAFSLLQILAIILSAVKMGYFFATRQFIFLLPITYILAGFSFEHLLLRETPILKKAQTKVDFQKVNQAFAVILVIGLLIASIASLINDRQYTKSSARQISYLLAASWQPGDKIWVMPTWDQYTYQFYFENIVGNFQISKNLTPTTWGEFSKPYLLTGKVFLLTEAVVKNEDWEKIKTLGFTLKSDINEPNLMWVYSP